MCVCLHLVEVDALVVVTAVVVAAVLGPVLFADVLGRHERLARVLVLHRQDLSIEIVTVSKSDPPRERRRYQGTPTQSHISPSILVCENKQMLAVVGLVTWSQVRHILEGCRMEGVGCRM